MTETQAAEMGGEWNKHAACLGLSELFFPVDGERSQQKHRREALAMATCQQCVVIDACLEVALSRDEHGIWAGTTREERQKMRRAARDESRLQQPQRRRDQMGLG